MAIGDQSDFLKRLKSTLSRWFTDETPILDGVLNGWAAAWVHLYFLYSYVKQQSRILTATDGFLDMIAADFFGARITRKPNQSDTSFRAAIIINMFRERATRNAITRILTDLTGRVPIVVEPQRPADTGAYGAPNSGYGLAGGYGSVLLPAQLFVTAFRPSGSGIPHVAGYGVSTGGYGVPSQAEYASMSMIRDQVGDDDIYAAVESVKVAGTTVWTRIKS
jgi:hypothetical protein